MRTSDEVYYDSTMTLYNDGWMFVCPGKCGGLEEIPAWAEPVSLPHAWNDTGWCYEKMKDEEPSGTGYYYKHLKSLPPGATELRFEGVSAACEVYVNGRFAGGNIGAYKPFNVKLNSNGRDDLLVLKVTDKASLKGLDPARAGGGFKVSPRYVDWPVPMGSSMKAGGIWRNVWLVSGTGGRITNLRTDSSGDRLQLYPEFSNGITGVPVEYELWNPDGELAAKVSGCGTQELKVPDVKPWYPRHPFLYKLRARARFGNGREQLIEQAVAFFDFAIRNSEFYVNGKPYFLRGQNGFPHTNIGHDVEYIRRYVSAVKSQGVEISRFHTEPPAHAWLDECDRQGVMVIFEMAIHGSMGCYAFDHPEFLENAASEMLELVREYRRHPSIVMWSLGNEMIVSCERDAGLARPLFEILERWTLAVGELDSRPVIANSGGDAAELCRMSVGDVDDVHQYGGWYVETLRDLRNYENFSRKNEMLFQPMIITESVAAYTDNNGCFMVGSGDTRQRKVVKARLGTLDVSPVQCLNLQSFILKEYAEQVWRMRRDDSNMSGYIPFGQYTWFFNPFDKGEDGLKPKPVWDVYRQVMGPVHVQFECWDRHVTYGGQLRGRLLLCHEDIDLPSEMQCTVSCFFDSHCVYQEQTRVDYHGRRELELCLPLDGLSVGTARLKLLVVCKGVVVASNYLDIKVYPPLRRAPGAAAVQVYDPADNLKEFCWHVPMERWNDDPPPPGGTLLIGAHGYDGRLERASDTIMSWCRDGGTVIILEQNPSRLTRNMLGMRIGVGHQRQPYWSRWATNMVRHLDHADIRKPRHPAFRGITAEDMSWWNADSYVAHCCLQVNGLAVDDEVLLSAGNGLGDDELMPVKHPDIDPGEGVVMLEKRAGLGRVIFCQALVGSKCGIEPVAGRLLMNLLDPEIHGE